MKFEDLFFIVQGKTDIDVISTKGLIIHKIKYDTYYEDVPTDIMDSEVNYLMAINFRKIEIGIKNGS